MYLVSADAFEVQPGNHFFDRFRLAKILGKDPGSEDVSFRDRPLVSHSRLADVHGTDSCDDFSLWQRSIANNQTTSVLVDNIGPLVDEVHDFFSMAALSIF